MARKGVNDHERKSKHHHATADCRGSTQLEILKNLTGKRTASEAIKHVVREYPRFCTHYKQEAKEHGELKRRYQEQGEAVRGFLSALDRLEKAGREKE